MSDELFEVPVDNSGETTDSIVRYIQLEAAKLLVTFRKLNYEDVPKDLVFQCLLDLQNFSLKTLAILLRFRNIAKYTHTTQLRANIETTTQLFSKLSTEHAFLYDERFFDSSLPSLIRGVTQEVVAAPDYISGLSTVISGYYPEFDHFEAQKIVSFSQKLPSEPRLSASLDFVRMETLKYISSNKLPPLIKASVWKTGSLVLRHPFFGYTFSKNPETNQWQRGINQLENGLKLCDKNAWDYLTSGSTFNINNLSGALWELYPDPCRFVGELAVALKLSMHEILVSRLNSCAGTSAVIDGDEVIFRIWEGDEGLASTFMNIDDSLSHVEIWRDRELWVKKPLFFSVFEPVHELRKDEVNNKLNQFDEILTKAGWIVTKRSDHSICFTGHRLAPHLTLVYSSSSLTPVLLFFVSIRKMIPQSIQESYIETILTMDVEKLKTLRLSYAEIGILAQISSSLFYATGSHPLFNVNQPSLAFTTHDPSIRLLWTLKYDEKENLISSLHVQAKINSKRTVSFPSTKLQSVAQRLGINDQDLQLSLNLIDLDIWTQSLTNSQNYNFTEEYRKLTHNAVKLTIYEIMSTSKYFNSVSEDLGQLTFHFTVDSDEVKAIVSNTASKTLSCTFKLYSQSKHYQNTDFSDVTLNDVLTALNPSIIAKIKSMSDIKSYLEEMTALRYDYPFALLESSPGTIELSIGSGSGSFQVVVTPSKDGNTIIWPHLPQGSPFAPFANVTLPTKTHFHYFMIFIGVLSNVSSRYNMTTIQRSRKHQTGIVTPITTSAGSGASTPLFNSYNSMSNHISGRTVSQALSAKPSQVGGDEIKLKKHDDIDWYIHSITTEKGQCSVNDFTGEDVILSAIFRFRVVGLYADFELDIGVADDMIRTGSQPTLTLKNHSNHTFMSFQDMFSAYLSTEKLPNNIINMGSLKFNNWPHPYASELIETVSRPKSPLFVAQKGCTAVDLQLPLVGLYLCRFVESAISIRFMCLQLALALKNQPKVNLDDGVEKIGSVSCTLTADIHKKIVIKLNSPYDETMSYKVIFGDPAPKEVFHSTTDILMPYVKFTSSAQQVNTLINENVDRHLNYLLFKAFCDNSVEAAYSVAHLLLVPPPTSSFLRLIDGFGSVYKSASIKLNLKASRSFSTMLVSDSPNKPAGTQWLALEKQGFRAFTKVCSETRSVSSTSKTSTKSLYYNGILEFVITMVFAFSDSQSSLEMTLPIQIIYQLTSNSSRSYMKLMDTSIDADPRTQKLRQLAIASQKSPELISRYKSLETRITGTSSGNSDLDDIKNVALYLAAFESYADAEYRVNSVMKSVVYDPSQNQDSNYLIYFILNEFFKQLYDGLTKRVHGNK